MTGIPRTRLQSSKDIFEIISDIQRDIRKLKRPQTTGWVNVNIVNQVAPHTVNTQLANLNKGTVSINIHITTGAAIAVGAQGGIAVTQVATFIAPFITTATRDQLIVSSTAPLVIAAIDNAGSLNLVNCVPGGTLPNGSVIFLSGTYLI